MAEYPKSTIADAVKPDGFVDFYQLIGEPPDAPVEQLRSRISALYDEAQANRDHRNVHKRREYQLLLELLPKARTVLLDESRRARYDAYAAEARARQATISFDEFISQVAGDADSAAGENVGLLGVHETTPKGTATVKTVTTAKSTKTKPPSARQGPTFSIGSAISVIVFMVVLLILVMLRQDIRVALAFAGLAGIIAWIVAFIGPGRGRKISG